MVADQKLKDEDYVRELKNQGVDIEMVLEAASTFYKEYAEQMQMELDKVQEAIDKERKNFINSNAQELEEINNKRREINKRLLDERPKHFEDHVIALDKIRTTDIEEYNLTKIKLDTDIQILEQQLQNVRKKRKKKQKKEITAGWKLVREKMNLVED